MIAATAAPPGVRHLAEALAATLADTPAPRKPPEDAATVGAAMRVSPLLILQDHTPDAVADAVATLVGDGRRVLVTAATTEELAAVRAALRPDVADRGLDSLPDLSPAELRELRRLLVTAVARPRRRARADQQLPATARVPHPQEVAALCARAEHTPPPGPAAAVVPQLLSGIDRVRREAVTSVARFVHRSLRAMYPRADRQWAWDLLSELIYSRHRPAFDQLLEDTAQAVAALERARHLPSVAVVAPLPPGALATLAPLRRVPLRRRPRPRLPARARRAPRRDAGAAPAAGRRAPPADGRGRAPRGRAPGARRAAFAHRPGLFRGRHPRTPRRAGAQRAGRRARPRGRRGPLGRGAAPRRALPRRGLAARRARRRHRRAGGRRDPRLRGARRPGRRGPSAGPDG